MKFPTSIIAIAALFASAEGVNVAATFNSCREAGGIPGGNQCPAGQISEKFSTFAECCKTHSDRSDCRCPKGCDVELNALKA